MRKKYIGLVLAVALLITVSVGVTVALLVASSNPVVNTFTIGSVNISMEESTGDVYTMIPGTPVPKDPTVTVSANSEGCWLFVQVGKENDFDAFCEYEIASGWSVLDGQADVFYRLVDKSSSNQTFSVLKDDSIYIKDSLTEEQLDAVANHPKLTFTAYAVQKDGALSVAEAWSVLNHARKE